MCEAARKIFLHAGETDFATRHVARIVEHCAAVQEEQRIRCLELQRSALDSAALHGNGNIPWHALFMPLLIKNVVYGPNQFAYTPERGARDALAYMLLVWLRALARGG